MLVRWSAISRSSDWWSQWHQERESLDWIVKDPWSHRPQWASNSHIVSQQQKTMTGQQVAGGGWGGPVCWCFHCCHRFVLLDPHWGQRNGFCTLLWLLLCYNVLNSRFQDMYWAYWLSLLFFSHLREIFILMYWSIFVLCAAQQCTIPQEATPPSIILWETHL